MGRCRSHEFMEYRMRVIDEICKNERLVRLLSPTEDTLPSDLPYNIVYPYELVSGIATERKRALGFDISSSEYAKNPIYKELTLEFFVICHRDQIKYPDPDFPGHYRCWFDLVVCELDEMLCGDRAIDIGVGELKLTKNEPYFVSYAREIPYKGRTLEFTVKDFVKGEKYGK